MGVTRKEAIRPLGGAGVGAAVGGHRTYYTGAACTTHDSGVLWRFTEGLLPSIAG